MLIALTLAAVLGLVAPSLAAVTQTPPAQTDPVVPAPASPAPWAGFPILAPAVESSNCGQLLATSAYCVTAPLTEVGALAETYLQTLEKDGWLAADGDDNRVILVRRKEDRTCDGMQMIAFYDESRPVAPTTMGFLGFATIPGNVCVAAPDQGPAAQ